MNEQYSNTVANRSAAPGKTFRPLTQAELNQEIEDILTPPREESGTLMTDGMQLTCSPSASAINNTNLTMQLAERSLTTFPSPPRENKKMVPNLNSNYNQAQKENNFNHLIQPLHFSSQSSLDKKTFQGSMHPS